jgi:hypothetical protein
VVVLVTVLVLVEAEVEVEVLVDVLVVVVLEVEVEVLVLVLVEVVSSHVPHKTGQFACKPSWTIAGPVVQIKASEPQFGCGSN